eukprot:4830570-Amphidinium_carterae.2
MTDWGSEFENTSLKIGLTNLGVSLTHSPQYQSKSNGTSERMVGIFKSGIRRLTLGANKPTPMARWSWVYAAKHVSVLLQHSIAEVAYTGPAFGETVAIWSKILCRGPGRSRSPLPAADHRNERTTLSAGATAPRPRAAEGSSLRPDYELVPEEKLPPYFGPRIATKFAQKLDGSGYVCLLCTYKIGKATGNYETPSLDRLWQHFQGKHMDIKNWVEIATGLGENWMELSDVEREEGLGARMAYLGQDIRAPSPYRIFGTTGFSTLPEFRERPRFPKKWPPVALDKALDYKKDKAVAVMAEEEQRAIDIGEREANEEQRATQRAERETEDAMDVDEEEYYSQSEQEETVTRHERRRHKQEEKPLSGHGCLYRSPSWNQPWENSRKPLGASMLWSTQEKHDVYMRKEDRSTQWHAPYAVDISPSQNKWWSTPSEARRRNQHTSDSRAACTLCEDYDITWANCADPYNSLAMEEPNVRAHSMDDHYNNRVDKDCHVRSEVPWSSLESHLQWTRCPRTRWPRRQGQYPPGCGATPLTNGVRGEAHHQVAENRAEAERELQAEGSSCGLRKSADMAGHISRKCDAEH